jgi:hypothetical protein
MRSKQYAEQLGAAIDEVNARADRPLARGLLWEAVGALLGVSAGAAQIAAARAGLQQRLKARPRLEVVCPKCRQPYKERLWEKYSTDGRCPRCLVRANSGKA